MAKSPPPTTTWTRPILMTSPSLMKENILISNFSFQIFLFKLLFWIWNSTKVDVVVWNTSKVEKKKEMKMKKKKMKNNNSNRLRPVWAESLITSQLRRAQRCTHHMGGIYTPEALKERYKKCANVLTKIQLLNTKGDPRSHFPHFLKISLNFFYKIHVRNFFFYMLIDPYFL